MALLKCSECGGEVSDKAVSCPHCGNPISVESSSPTNSLPAHTSEEGPNANRSFSFLRVIGIVFLVFGALFGVLLVTMKAYPTSAAGKFVSSVVNEMSQVIWGLRDGLQQKTGQVTVDQSISGNRGEPMARNLGGPLAVRVSPDGTKIYPVQLIDLWGYQFYTSKIDGSGIVDIGSGPKQSIGELLNTLRFPPALTRQLIVIQIDPTIVSSRDRLTVPWLGADIAGIVQPQGGTYQDARGGAIISLNNRTGFNLSVLAHELGHLIGQRMTDQEWSTYYQLRGIPAKTPRNLEDWTLSPSEDFAEVYRNIYYPKGESVKTSYGLLVPKDGSTEPLTSDCFSLFLDLRRDWLSKNSTTSSVFLYDQELISKAERAIQIDSRLQTCRNEHPNSPFSFLGPLYIRQVSDATVKFVGTVVARLSK